MSLLNAVTDDLASLINRLDLEVTPRTPGVSPFGSAQRSLGNRESASFESPLMHSKRIRTATGSPLRAGLLNRISTTSSVASLRPYADRKVTSPKSGSASTETRNRGVAMSLLSVSKSLPRRTSTGTSRHEEGQGTWFRTCFSQRSSAIVQWHDNHCQLVQCRRVRL